MRHQLAVLAAVVEHQVNQEQLEIPQVLVQAKEILAAHLILFNLLWAVVAVLGLLVQMAQHQLVVMAVMELRHQ
jgi:hypothetical protein